MIVGTVKGSTMTRARAASSARREGGLAGAARVVSSRPQIALGRGRGSAANPIAAAAASASASASAAPAAPTSSAPVFSLGVNVRAAELPPATPPAEGLRAIVVGSGVAGLAAARVLSDTFDEVLILERDGMPGDGAAAADAANASTTSTATGTSSSGDIARLSEAVSEGRRGVPQWDQPHVMLSRGLQELEALFPGLRADLSSAGAVDVPTPAGWTIFDDRFGGEVPHTNVVLDMLTATRSLFETTLRVRLARDCPNVRTLSGAVASGLVWEDDEGGVSSGGSAGKPQRVAGVELSNGRGSLRADLVVDASGRGSRTPEWLEAAGWAPPPTVTIDSHLVYTSAVYELPSDYSGPTATMITAAAPDSRSGIVMPVEGGRHHLILAARGDERCDNTDEGILRFSEALPHPCIADMLRHARRVSDVRTYSRTANFRRRYEDLADGVPGGLAVIGDSVCAFNPVYGQGMSVGVLQALALGERLRAALPAKQQQQQSKQQQQQQQQQRDLAAERAALPGATRAFMRSVGDVVAIPWALATGNDAAFVPGFKRSPAEAAVNAVFAEVARLSQHDEDVHGTLLRTMHLLEPPAALVSPRILGKLLVDKVRGLLGIGHRGSRAGGAGAA